MVTTVSTPILLNFVQCHKAVLSHKVMLSHKMVLSHKVVLSHRFTIVSHKVVLSWQALWRSAPGCEPANIRGLRRDAATLARVHLPNLKHAHRIIPPLRRSASIIFYFHQLAPSIPFQNFHNITILERK